MRAGQRDPWWGLEGRSARRDRLGRRVVGLIVAALSVILLALILAALPRVDAHEIVLGSDRSVLFGALFADVAACLLLVVGQIRQSRIG